MKKVSAMRPLTPTLSPSDGEREKLSSARLARWLSLSQSDGERVGVRGRTVRLTRCAALIPVALRLLTFIAAADESALVPVADPAPLLQELGRKMAAVRSVYLEFTQERHLKLFNEPLKSQGLMLIDKPGLIRWETLSP